MQLVDEQHDLPVRLFDLLQHGLEPVFEFATILRARQHRAEVERDHPLVFEALRHVARGDAARQSFDDGGFAHAGLADQHGIVLGAPAQHLDHAANLFIASDHRVKLAAPGQLRQVLGVFFQRLEFALRVLVRHALRSAHRGQGLQNNFVRGADGCQRILRGIAFLARHPEQKVFGRDVFVLEVRSFLESLLDDLVQRLADAGLRGRARDPRQLLLDLVQAALQPFGGNTDLPQHGGNHSLAVLDQRQQQVRGHNLGIALLRRALLRLLHRLLRFHSKFFPTNCHKNSSSQ